jgi:hypothetical protein
MADTPHFQLHSMVNFETYKQRIAMTPRADSDVFYSDNFYENPDLNYFEYDSNFPEKWPYFFCRIEFPELEAEDGSHIHGFSTFNNAIVDSNTEIHSMDGYAEFKQTLNDYVKANKEAISYYDVSVYLRSRPANYNTETFPAIFLGVYRLNSYPFDYEGYTYYYCLNDVSFMEKECSEEDKQLFTPLTIGAGIVAVATTIWALRLRRTRKQ